MGAAWSPSFHVLSVTKESSVLPISFVVLWINFTKGSLCHTYKTKKKYLSLFISKVHIIAVGWATFLPILVFFRLFVLNLRANACQRDHVTLRPWPLTLEVMPLVGDTGLCVPRLNFECLPIRKIWHTFDLNFSRPGDLDLWTFNPETGAQYYP